ncbi:MULTISPECIES: bifunctional precorrin-2 dehydrogenase/sirohydrochlorin ferrochelatase [unclassified Aureispira]|uniref:precorrin-2 dehydrogenase/sirohydrochlorin ferrochelatase family protein n=1 Tax=unclassified Aureispira TaxID=2649989 RepID=UPI000696847B|nr:MULTISPECIES: bifunctional precorrin-2 dehydrogenase/sirohydrochlorin ferrochelatase [unclassified Aureispira]WMX15852.1 bifunctional precorrin-2 dehydrogenase/sirohydrochlorin ferrochelatase [Aureispira sp. CCB-E]
MNTLYPVFLKVNQLPILIVGGGHVGYEKISLILKNSPDARIILVAIEISKKIRSLLVGREHQVTLIERPFQLYDLEKKSLVIVATNNRSLNKYIWSEAKSRGTIVNVADTPLLCDFYLGSVVTKGDLKIAISTNGKSPTFAKRLRQLLENILPEEIEGLLENMYDFRQTLGVDFERKVKILNALTESLLDKSA